AITFRTEKRALISFADYDRDGPQQHGDEREKQTSANHQTDKNFARVPRNALSFVDCSEGEHFADSAGRIAAKANSFQTVYLSINERSDLTPSLQFSALVLHSFNLKDTFLVAADLKLIDKCDDSQQRCLCAAGSIITAADCTSVGFCRVWINLGLGLACTREIAIHKRAPDFAPPAANILTEAVVR